MEEVKVSDPGDGQDAEAQERAEVKKYPQAKHPINPGDRQQETQRGETESTLHIVGDSYWSGAACRYQRRDRDQSGGQHRSNKLCSHGDLTSVGWMGVSPW